MNREFDRSTALLAAVFAASLLNAPKGQTQPSGSVDAHRAREISVLARVLEKRLGVVLGSPATDVAGGIPALHAHV